MNEAIVCSTPVKTFSVSRAPLRELLNFLFYGRYPELLNERALWQQPFVFSEKMPRGINELKDFLGAEKCDKNKKLFFDCEKGENQAAVLLHNRGALFWIHYFRSGIGLVSLSFFGQLASAESSLLNRARSLRTRFSINGLRMISNRAFSPAKFLKRGL